MKDLGPDCISCGTDDFMVNLPYMRPGHKAVERYTGHKEEDGSYRVKFAMCARCFRYWKKVSDDELQGKCPHARILGKPHGHRDRVLEAL